MTQTNMKILIKRIEFEICWVDERGEKLMIKASEKTLSLICNFREIDQNSKNS